MVVYIPYSTNGKHLKRQKDDNLLRSTPKIFPSIIETRDLVDLSFSSLIRMHPISSYAFK
jgi:hypothetical protein